MVEYRSIYVITHVDRVKWAPLVVLTGGIFTVIQTVLDQMQHLGPLWDCPF